MERLDKPNFSDIRQPNRLGIFQISHHRPSSFLQPTRTPTIRHSTNIMPLKPLQSMIRMIPMPTSHTKAQKPSHGILLIRQLLLRRPLARIRRSQPKSANRTSRHVSTALQTYRACVRCRSLDFCLIGRALLRGFFRFLRGILGSGRI